jgi:hypothetical protein
VEAEETSFVRQRLGKQVFAATDKQVAIEELLGTVFPIRSVQGGYKGKFSRESQSSYGVSSERLIEIWALQWRLRRWRYEFRCGVLTSGQRRDHGS